MDMISARLPFDYEVAEIVGAIMQVLNGSELSVTAVESLTFYANGTIEILLNEAFIKLLEFTHDAELRVCDPVLDQTMRSELQEALQKIGDLAGVPPRNGRLALDTLRVLPKAVA